MHSQSGAESAGMPGYKFTETEPANRNRLLNRTVAAAFTTLPAITFCGLWLCTTPDLETWLAVRFDGIARTDAFDGVADIAPWFAVLFAVTSLLAAGLVAFRKTAYLLSLAAGPILAGLVYLGMHGVTDPAWFTLLALQTIGMLVGSPVTAVYLAVTAKRRHGGALR